MATYIKANNATNLNLVGSWSTGVVPTATDIGKWDSTVTAANTVALGGALSWLGIEVTNPGGAVNISTTAATLTLGASGVNLSAASQNLSINSPVVIALFASQSWTVAAGRTFTSSAAANAISGNAKNLTLDGLGTKTLPGSATGWTNSTVTVAAGIVNASNPNSLGAASNSVVVSSGANLAATAAIAQTAITLNGAGISGGINYGALYTTNALANTQTITLGTTGTVISVNAASFLPVIITSAGVTSITLNIVGTNNTTFATSSSYSVSSGVRLQSYTTAGAAGSGTYSFGTGVGATDSNTGTGFAGGGLGASSNVVVVEPTGCVYYAGTGTSFVTLSRSYAFQASTTPTVAQAQVLGGGSSSTSSRMDIDGPIALSGTAGQAVVFNSTANYSGNLRNIFRLLGTVSGAADLYVGAMKSGFGGRCSVGIGPSFTHTGWTGTLYPDSISYYQTSAANVTFPLALQKDGANEAVINSVGNSSANHSSYSSTATTQRFNQTADTGPLGDLTLGGGDWTTAPTIWGVNANTLTLNFSFTGTPGPLTKTNAGTLVLAGNNTAITSTSWNGGNLSLNSAGSVGSGTSATITIAAVSGILDNTSGNTVALTQSGAIAVNASFTWKGTSSLTLGAGNVTASADRTITLASTSETGTLKFAGPITTSTAATTWNFGGSTAGAKQRVTLGGANASLTASTTADQHQVTAGYFRIEDNNGLGAAATTTTWWVGATNSAFQTTKAALELAGVTTPPTKNVNLYNIGPNDDGALIGVSGTSVFGGAIIVPNVAGTRIGVKAGATLTLDGSGLYPNLNPTNAGTPISFTAESSGTLNVNRVLGGGGTSNVGTVTITNGSGTVVLSQANLHTGGTVCSAGTTRVTNVTATGTGNVTVSAGATLESTVQSNFQATLSLGTLSSPTRAILKFAA